MEYESCFYNLLFSYGFSKQITVGTVSLSPSVIWSHRLTSLALSVFNIMSFGQHDCLHRIKRRDICKRGNINGLGLMNNDTFCNVSFCFPFQADLSELLGLKDYMGVMYFITLLEKVVPVSDEHVKVTEEKFDGVEVVLYQPKQQESDTELRRAVIYLHGGGWCLGSSRKLMGWPVFSFITQIYDSVTFKGG